MNSVEQYIFQQNMAQLDTHWEPFAKEIMALQTPDTFTCLYATDIHYIRKYAYYAVVYSRLQEMVAFSGHIGADLLAVTGDLADGNTTLTRQYRDLYDVVSLLRQSKTTFLACPRATMTTAAGTVTSMSWGRTTSSPRSSGTPMWSIPFGSSLRSGATRQIPAAATTPWTTPSTKSGS